MGVYSNLNSSTLNQAYSIDVKKINVLCSNLVASFRGAVFIDVVSETSTLNKFPHCIKVSLIKGTYCRIVLLLNDTHKEKLCFTQLGTRMAAWLLLTFLICLHNQLRFMHSIITY